MPNYIVKANTNFPTQIVSDMFAKVNGRSSIAKLSAQKPIPFNGATEMVFTMDGKAQIVGESGKKDKGEANVEPVVIRPLKFLYQTRVSNEFMTMSEEARIPVLQNFADGFAKKIAEGLDIAAFHGLNPYTMAAATQVGNNHFDAAVTGNTATFVAASADDVIDTLIQTVVADGGVVNGIALSPTAGAALAAIKVNGVVQYPEFRFGQNPDNFYGMGSDVNPTVSMKAAAGTVTDHIILGDFQNAFRWGYAKNVPLEIIEYGDPDQTGRDLKAYNEICLRSEAFIGWGILDADSFARGIVTEAVSGSGSE